MKFTVIDLETANPKMHSICQIGIVVFENGREIASDVTLIDPQQPFSSVNTGIHGISEQTVTGSFVFPQVYDQLSRMLRGQIVVSHTHFDRVALEQVCDFYSCQRLECRWLDSAMVARRAWSRFSKRGYGLANLASEFGIEFQHHDALEDARAAGKVLLKAMEDSGTDLEGWLGRVTAPALGNKGEKLRRTGDGDGPLIGETIVFTGNFSQVKAQLADKAHIAGAAVEPGVNKRTTMLVVGDQDWNVVGTTGKSAKHRKVEDMIAKGAPILIVVESDFDQLVRGAGGLD